LGVLACEALEPRPTTRTFLPCNKKELAMIEPVFPLAPKITYIPSAAMATLSSSLFILVSPWASIAADFMLCRRLVSTA
jgi:hypothetical protein